jgi:hypothetical protein
MFRTQAEKLTEMNRGNANASMIIAWLKVPNERNVRSLRNKQHFEDWKGRGKGNWPRLSH